MNQPMRNEQAGHTVKLKPDNENGVVSTTHSQPDLHEKSISVQEAFESYLVNIRAARLTAKTQSFYNSQLTPFVDFCQQHGTFDVKRISPMIIRAYLICLEDRGLSDYSVHAGARAIRAFLNFCVREEYLSSSPMAKVAMPRLDKRILPAFSEEDVHRLLAACQTSRDRAIILFLLDTGCRISELVHLNADDINLFTGEVHVRSGKGRKDRTVFLGNAARESLQAYYAERGTPAGQDPVWLSQTRGMRLTVSGVQQMFKRLGRQAKVNHCSPHTFRRTFAIWSLRNGMDLFRLARLMGHSDVGILRQYLYLLKDDLRAAHAQYGSVDRLLGQNQPQ